MDNLLVPSVRCPRCGSRPVHRISPALRELHADRDPDELVGNYQCVSRTCRQSHPPVRYPVTARAYQDAERPKARAA